MRAQWHTLHAHFVMQSNRLSFQTHFGQIRDRHRPMVGLCDPAALFGALHAPGGDPEARNAILSVLVGEAQTGAATADTAMTLVILGLWPGLDAVHGRLLRYFRQDPERLAAELSGRIAAGIRMLDLTRVTRIAATLIRNTERDTRRMLHREWSAARQLRELTDASAVLEEPPLCASGAADLDADSLRKLGLWLCHLLGPDAGLVLAIAVVGENQRHAARAAGLSYETGRKRYQRAIGRLRRHLTAPDPSAARLSRTRPEPGVSLAEARERVGAGRTRGSHRWTT